MQFIALSKTGEVTSVADCSDQFEAREVLSQLDMPEDYFVYVGSADQWMKICQNAIQQKLNEERFQHGIPTEVQNQVIN